MPRTRASHKQDRPSRELLQTSANVVTVITGVGGAITLISGQFIWVLPGLAAVAFTFYLMRARRWGPAALGVLAVSLAAASSIIILAQRPHHNPSESIGQGGVASLPPSSPTPAATSPTPSAAGSETPAASAAPRVLLDGDVTFQRTAAVDVDTAKPVPLKEQTGADGNLDLYYDSSGSGIFYAHETEGIYQLGSGISDPYASCSDQFDPGSSDREILPYAMASMGTEFCFKTSDGRMAYAAVSAVNSPSGAESPQSVTLHVIVWDQTVH